MRASVLIRLAHLGGNRITLEPYAAEFSLQVEGTGAEHTDCVDCVYDVSNPWRLV